MYADRARTRFQPASMGAALALNGLLIAAVMFAAPKITGVIADDSLITTNVPLPIEPPPLPPPPNPKPNTPSVSEITRTTPVIEAPGTFTLPTLPPQPSMDFSPVTPGTGAGEGVGVAPSPSPVVPVLIAARIDPRFANSFQPDYPGAELRAQTEGKATVRVLIGTDGRVKAVEPVAADSPGFLAATRRQALARWRFTPATRDGVPVEAWREMTVQFRIQG